METIKISDLSVGDWVMVNGKPRKISVLAEVWNGSNEVLVGYVAHVNPNGYNVVYYKPIEHIKPIPITAEILEQNGFEKAAIGDIYRHESDIEVSLYGDGWWHTVSLDEYSLHKINGVHQLQHLLRLYGEYREVNL